MARITSETVTALARELYGYELRSDAAASVAHMIGAIGAYLGRIDSAQVEGLQPPFGYPVLIGDAGRFLEKS
jgi:hypothetical protein